MLSLNLVPSTDLQIRYVLYKQKYIWYIRKFLDSKYYNLFHIEKTTTNHSGFETTYM